MYPYYVICSREYSPKYVPRYSVLVARAGREETRVPLATQTPSFIINSKNGCENNDLQEDQGYNVGQC